MFDIDAILTKADLLGYVERAGATVRGKGNRYSCACPLHGGDNPTAFSIYHKDGRWLWNCFTGSCGGGDAIRFVEVWQGLDFKRACEWINGGAIQDAQGMKESAERRHAQALEDLRIAKEKEEARREELRVAEIHLHYHNTMTQYHKDEWTKAGIDEGMQSFWTLGGCSDFKYTHDENEYHTPTLTIPIFNEANELMTIQHRLLNPVDPRDKYRPERAGLRSHPFLAVPPMGFDGGIIWVMEGAKKAMVTWTRADTDWQCIGLSSQEIYKGMVETLRPVGKRVIVVPDPNSERNPNAFKKAHYLAHEIGAKIVRIKDKMDDLILSADLKQDDLFALWKYARRA